MSRDRKPTGHEGAGKATRATAAARSVRRWLYALLGVLSVGLGFLGIFVPGLPTTIFLILASYFFTRSCPWLEDRLVRARIFRPYLRYVDGERAMPLRARVVTIAVMWTAVGVSFAILHARGALSVWLVTIVGAAAVAGSCVVAVAFSGDRGQEEAASEAVEARAGNFLDDRTVA